MGEEGGLINFLPLKGGGSLFERGGGLYSQVTYSQVTYNSIKYFLLLVTF